MSQAPTPSETPMTDAALTTVDGARIIPHGTTLVAIVEHARRLERDRARLMEALRGVISDAMCDRSVESSPVLEAEALLKELTC